MALEPTLCFKPLDEAAFDSASAVCIGTGRFLRAVLVPTFVELGCEVILAQTRGTSFGQYLRARPDRTYEVDTVLQDGTVLAALLPVAAAGTLGSPEGREAFLRLPSRLRQLRYIGLGLTEAGIVHNGRSIIDLAEFLHACFLTGRTSKLSIINTDNMPFNGDAVRNHVHSCGFTHSAPRAEEFQRWLQNHAVFHNTMVDRITSHRAGDSDVPRAEPLPGKALVIEDLDNMLPQQFGNVLGVVVRSQHNQLELDIALKLRIANGLHTAMVYAMSLGRLFQTDACISHPDILPYLEQLFERDIVHACAEFDMPRLSATVVFSEWMARLQHPHLSLGCLFVCQNATQKMAIRLLPSVKATLAAGEVPSEFMVFALAVILRFLTPIGAQPRLGENPPVFVGHLDAGTQAPNGKEPAQSEYTTGLSVRPQEGTYEFRDGDGTVPLLLRPLGREAGCNAAAAVSLVTDILSRLEGFDPRRTPEHVQLAKAVGVMLQRFLNGEAALEVLASLRPQQPLYLTEGQLQHAVRQEVDAVEAIDVHTHLFSSAHGEPLMQYGIDAMLTYHHLVSEYLATSQENPGEFYDLLRAERAERVWQGLFVRASPISEHCRDVLTTLSALGLHEEVATRDLQAIRRWYAGQDAVMFNEKMMRLARLRYIVTSHDPFAREEATACLQPPKEPPRYRRALSVDKLLECHRGGASLSEVCEALKAAGEETTLLGALALLRRSAAALRPFLVTAATPRSFDYGDEPEGGRRATVGVTTVLSMATQKQLLDLVVLPLCRELGLPLSLRMGARRGLNPALGLAGDGLGPAQVESLTRLCAAHPKVKFMATVLSRGDQHEVAVTANKFRNLHLWGSWRYCNDPSVVSEVTRLRLEMLGTGFTFQASSARVHDQLVYKWVHARAVLATELTASYLELMRTGWRVSRGDLRRDVERLLGGAFEQFLAKTL